jgi:hypothetical protein
VSRGMTRFGVAGRRRQRLRGRSCAFPATPEVRGVPSVGCRASTRSATDHDASLTSIREEVVDRAQGSRAGNDTTGSGRSHLRHFGPLVTQKFDFSGYGYTVAEGGGEFCFLFVWDFNLVAGPSDRISLAVL